MKDTPSVPGGIRVKNYAAIATFAMALALAPAANAQSCWTDIPSWTGNHSLTGSAPSGSCQYEPGATCTTNHAVTADVSLTGGALSCSEIFWGNSGDTITSVSLDDTVQYQCQTNPPVTETITAVGTGGGFGAASMLINVSNNTYYYQPNDSANATVTEQGCSSSSSNGLYGLWPDTNWPQTFSLPTSPQELTTDNFSFQGLTGFDQTASFLFSFDLTPNYNDCDDCKQKGGKAPPTDVPEELQGDPFEAFPISSSISPQNQSLGEDVAIAGTGFYLHYESERAPGVPADRIATADAAVIGGWTLNVHHAYDPSTNTLFLGDGNQRNGYQLGTPVSYNGNLLLTSKDGGEVYVFNGRSGQHLQTLRPLTGALVYQFGYDTAGLLVTVTDALGNVTTIQRSATQQPTAIVSPYGQTTALAVDSNGFLSEVTDPLGKSQSFVNTSGGLLTSRTDANGNSFNYTYDANGRLVEDADSLGGYVQLARTNASTGIGWTVNETTSMGRTSSYQSSFTLPWLQNSATATYSDQRTNTWPDGLQAGSSKNLQNGQITESFSLPDGTSNSETLGPDPVWGLQVPVTTSESLTEGNLTMNITGSRSTTLGTAGNPFTVTSETDTQTINGRTYSFVFTGSNRTWVNTSPAGRTSTIGLDSLERIASTQIEELTATDLSYDSQGRLASATQGARTTTFAYGLDGFLATVTDPLKQTISFTYDADGNLLTMILPDGRLVTYTYDANGNLTSITPPGKSAHNVAYNAVNLSESYTPPIVLGTGATIYAYNLDHNLTTITRPDGKTITYSYDTGGRLISIGTPTGTTSFTYNSTTGNLATAAKGGEKIAYAYNGPLPIKSTWAGTVAGSVSRNYNDNFWVGSESVGGGTNIAFQYDKDGLLNKAGAMQVARNAKNGLISGTTLGVATDSLGYNSFGELTSYTASVNGASVYSVKYARDADGRVTAKSETINGVSNTYSYTYDQSGRLTAATKNSATDSYTYDSNSNRLTATTPSGTVDGTYDAQDRLLTYGNSSYGYTANGELASQTSGTQKTTYGYDVLGNLTTVTLPNGTKINYVIDPQNRRVGKQVNGVLQSGFLYNGHQIVAQLNSTNQLVSQFVYGTSSTTPDYMVSGGVTYRIFSDQLGSPVLVVNTSTGAIAEQISYGEFGNVLSDTNPGFQPFGFAGGLYDQDTTLLRFGARDYSAVPGRWTAKDPMLFDGGNVNLYGYTLNDPINQFDPSGLQTIPGPNQDGIYIDPNAPPVPEMDGVDPNAEDYYCKKDTPVGRECIIGPNGDPRVPPPTNLQKVWSWITKVLSGSDKKFQTPMPRTCSAVRG